jgi:lysophospholipase L1-like esterase
MPPKPLIWAPPLALALTLSGCGGGGGPTSPGTAPTPSVPTFSVMATVFYDQNRNGQLDAGENTRVPGVDVVIGRGTGKSAPGTGQAVVTGVTEGPQSVALRVDSLPAYFQPESQLSVQVPAASEVRIPLTLPIGDNHANLYLGFGDSITYGDGSSDKQGYVLKLQNLLGPHFGRAEVRSWGRPGTVSVEGATKTRETLRWYDPAYVLILYGTNDWHDQQCQGKPASSCYTIGALRDMIEDIKDWDSLPVLATIPPVNPAKTPEGRNRWYDDMNVQIKALAQQQQVVLCDMNAEFKAQPNLAALFADDVHPNDAGYQVMAQAWFKAITRGRAQAASAARPLFGFSLF